MEKTKEQLFQAWRDAREADWQASVDFAEGKINKPARLAAALAEGKARAAYYAHGRTLAFAGVLQVGRVRV